VVRIPAACVVRRSRGHVALANLDGKSAISNADERMQALSEYPYHATNYSY